jgi:hypothetical protein
VEPTSETASIQQLKTLHLLRKPFDAPLLLKTLNNILHPN